VTFITYKNKASDLAVKKTPKRGIKQCLDWDHTFRFENKNLKLFESSLKMCQYQHKNSKKGPQNKIKDIQDFNSSRQIKSQHM